MLSSLKRVFSNNTLVSAPLKYFSNHSFSQKEERPPENSQDSYLRSSVMPAKRDWERFEPRTNEDISRTSANP
jgi:hypothetical protein